jgi:thiamine biosynthesis lipoprotein
MSFHDNFPRTADIFKISAAFTAAAVIAATAGCSPAERRTVSRSRMMMDTLVEIKTPSGTTENIIDAAFEEIARVDKKYSVYGGGETMTALNAADGGFGAAGVILDDETCFLMEFALRISSMSSGALDPAVGTLSRLWRDAEKRPPSADKIAAAIAQSGTGRIKIADGKLYKKRETLLDFGAFAKGYAVDKAVEKMKSAGAQAGLVNAGGDIRVFGPRTWNIAVKHPRKESEFLGVLSIRDKAVATSGDYERFKELGGRKYHHIIDPFTGYPAEGVISVSVLADDCITADALSTAVFVLGVERGIALIEKIESAECVIVDKLGGIHKTSGLATTTFTY